ncbi:hypothetical protein [Oleisolibacter albus]|uniref:hypothetical protein n=1 Tax=Oleisolibacter albus TaxID=2171757 RepID=UPI0012D7E201|nr:hypothetical protein [Oleisolibacter albus]
MIAKALDFLLKTVILLALLNGIVDGLLFTQRWVRDSVADLRAKRPELARSVIVNMAQDPGIGRTPKPIAFPDFTIAGDGRRAPRAADALPAQRRILMLGASQAFGMHVQDKQVVSTLLEQDHPGWEVMNYAAPGETLIGNRIRLSFLHNKGVAIDQVLVVTGLLEIGDRCLVRDPGPEKMHELALGRLFAAFGRKLTEKTETTALATCAQPERANALAQAIYGEMSAMLATADSLHLPVRIVIAPTDFSRPLTAEQGLNNPVIRSRYEVLRPAYDSLRHLIVERQDPRIIDMSDAFDTVETPFIDAWSHFSPDAHKALADLLGPLVDSYGVGK